MRIKDLRRVGKGLRLDVNDRRLVLPVVESYLTPADHYTDAYQIR